MVYIDKLYAQGNTFEEALGACMREFEFVITSKNPKDGDIKVINGQKYIYASGEWTELLNEIVVTGKRIENARAFIVAPLGIRLHTTASNEDPDYKNKTGLAKQIYSPGEQILFIGPSPDAPGWSYIQTHDGNKGHIEYVNIAIIPVNGILDNFTQTFHYVNTEGEGLENLINRYFKDFNFKRGRDRRSVAEAIIFLNQSSKHNHGLFFQKKEKGIAKAITEAVIDAHDPFFKETRKLYSSVQLSMHKVLRIPTPAYVTYLGKLGKLSTRPEVFNTLINVGEFAVDLTAGIAGVVVGVLEGFIMGIWDALVGLVDLVTIVIDVIKKLVSGTFIEDLKKLYHIMVNLTSKQLLELADTVLGGMITKIKNFNKLSAYEKGHIIGKIIGTVLLEVVLAFFTGGTVNAAKWAGKLGKFAKVANKIAETGQDILGPLKKMSNKAVSEVKNKIPKKYRNKNNKGDYSDGENKGVLKQTVLNLLRAEALVLDRTSATIFELMPALQAVASPILPNAKLYFKAERGLKGTYDVYFKASPPKIVDNFTDGNRDDVGGKEMNGLANAGSDLVRGVSKSTFKTSFSASDDIAEQAWTFFKNEDWSNLENLFNTNKLNKWGDDIYPPNDGFERFTTEPLTVGTKLDRYGGYIDDVTQEFKDEGKFFANEGEALTNRALPAGSDQKFYSSYEVVEEIPNVKKGEAIPWFGENGKGIQYQVTESIDDLIEAGYIIRVSTTAP